MQTSTISRLVGSSQYRALADDALKDEDNAAWVMELEPEIRREWIERIGWIRLVDRLAEGELLENNNYAFQRFRQDWHLLVAENRVDPTSPYANVLSRMRHCWLGKSSSEESHLAVKSWNLYLEAIATYHKTNLVIDTLDDYEMMLAGLAGSFFQVLPFLSGEYYQAVFYLGIIDQFYNNLRDLLEDSLQGVCYFPTELLEQFGVTREEILHPGNFTNPGYYRMMQFWMEDYLPRLRRQTYSLVFANNLHPSWLVLREWSLHRYHRIERIFYHCRFNYVEFNQQYWQEVRRDLKRQLRGCQRLLNPSSARTSSPKILQMPQPFYACQFSTV